ncbi:MAG TPA: NAD(P)/FAD-dependent oxidoreductase [Chloroflexota bacterium]|nr:NAD(P)/FAD-dependent oxidoreductase [Chloroflexota bacterium]
MNETGRAVDVLIVGGGPAGLSAAIYLARYLRSVLLFDLDEGRSTFPQTNHNYLGFVDGVEAVELRRLGREQLRRYAHVRIEHQCVERVDRAEGRFRALGAFGAREAKAVVLATGVRDHYPSFPGWESYVGRSMFWCLTCDGYESRGRKIVVVGESPQVVSEAVQLARLSTDVTLITGRLSLSADDRSRLRRHEINIVEDSVEEYRGADGKLHVLVTSSGGSIPVEALFVVETPTPRTDLARSVGCAVDEAGYIVVDTEQKTDIPGVFAAGDATHLHCQQVVTAVHEGAQAASAANHYLYPPDLKAN